MFFRTSTQSLEKRMMPLFEFPEHVPEKFLACFTRVRSNDVIIIMTSLERTMNRGGLWRGIAG